ncbi:MAG: hypothetical protein JXA90_04020, partial [Planctomycetes bacterium]|nr:hypothetical protein [Planctomycetota bacterium]
MIRSEESQSFLDYIADAKIRFLQERDLGLDLYFSGYLGILVFCLSLAITVIFLLAIFGVIPRRRHVVCLLLGLGALAFLAGLGSSYWNYQAVLSGSVSIVREVAGARPVDEQQEAAVILIPLLLGAASLAMGVLGCLYLALFWGTSLLPGKKGEGT